MRLSPVLATLALLTAPVAAKPMPPATLERALQSKTVVLASYDSCDSTDVSYFGGLRATFKVESVWKGKLAKGQKTLEIAYRLHDGSPCIEPHAWRFDEKKMMPKRGQRFLLFLTPARKGHATYRGPTGRWLADHLTKAELADLKALVGKGPVKVAPKVCPKCAKRSKQVRELRNTRLGMTWRARCTSCWKQWQDKVFAFEKRLAAEKKKRAAK